MNYRDPETGIDYRDVHRLALIAAQAEADTYGPEDTRGLNCGFAWVQLTPGNHPYVRALKSLRAGSKHWSRGWCLWAGSQLHNRPVQQIDIHLAAARGYADAVKAAKIGGLEVAVGSRYD